MTKIMAITRPTTLIGNISIPAISSSIFIPHLIILQITSSLLFPVTVSTKVALIQTNLSHSK